MMASQRRRYDEDEEEGHRFVEEEFLLDDWRSLVVEMASCLEEGVLLGEVA